MNTTTILIANQKGGVGKTLTAVSLAHGLAIKGFSTCLIDLDSQGNCANSLGVPAGNDLYYWLQNLNSNANLVGIPARDNLYLIRSDKTTAILKTILAGVDFRERILSKAINHLDQFDIVILDAAPSADILHTAAILAADYIIIPTRLDQYSVKGVIDIIDTVYSINQMGGSASIYGILPTFYELTTSETDKQLNNLVAQFGPLIMPVIPLDTRVRELNRLGKTLWESGEKPRSLIGLDGKGGYKHITRTITNLLFKQLKQAEG